MEKQRKETIKFFINILKISGIEPNLKDLISMTKEQKSNGGKCILLSRVSTEQQDLDQQTNELRKAAHNAGYTDNDIIVIQDKESAIKLSFEEREGITKLIDTINKEDIERVIVYEISRIARRPDVFYKVRDILIEKKIQLQVLTPSFCLLNDDFTINENSNLLIGIFLSLAESEARLMKERMIRGKLKRAKENKCNGSKVAFGYTLDKEGHYIPDEQDSEIIKKIFRLYTEENKSPWHIAKEMMETGELWQTNFDSARQFIFYIVRNPLYGTGSNENNYFYKYHKQKQKFIMRAPKIISEETWKKAQELNNIDNPYRKGKQKKYIYFAHNIITDMDGHILGPNKKSAYYTISAYDKRNFGLKRICISINMIDSLLWHITKNIISNNSETDKKNIIKNLRQKQTDCFNKITRARQDEERIKEEIQRIENRIISGRLDEETGNTMEEERYNRLIDLEVKITSFEEETLKLQEQLESIQKEENIYDVDSMTDEEKKILVQKYISSVKINKKSLYGFDVYVDGELYEMNTNSASRWIKKDGVKIEYEYLKRYERK